jgi:L-sorbose 1-phosphate reductase
VAFNVQYHFEHGSYQHEMGIVEGGAMALLGGTGPMGLGAIDYAIHGPRKPKTLLVTDIDQARLDRAEHLFSKEEARKNGVDVHYVNTGSASNQDLIDLADSVGYHDVFVFAPVPALVEQASDIMCENGCLNFFAGPTNTEFKATINFYKVHYAAHHVAANSGGNTEDMRIALKYMSEGKLNPAIMITHVGGLDSTADTLANLPNIGGGKKLVYNHISMPMTAIDDFEALGKDNDLFRNLAEICSRHDGLWSVEAENYLLNHAPKMPGVE